MLKAQGSLEFMVIIAVVLAIVGITTLYMSGLLSGQSSQASVALCKQASQTCKLSKLSSPNDPCLSCDTACINPATGKEIFTGAIYCCSIGNDKLIYQDSTECMSIVTTLCGNSNLDSRFGEECDPPGSACGPSGTGTCSSNCVCTECGNGRVEPGEECETGLPCSGSLTCSNCLCTGCGNGRIEGAEQCEVGIACSSGICMTSTCQCLPSLTISITSPAFFTNANPVPLVVKTSKISTCTYGGGNSMTTADGLTHSASLSLSEGSYSYSISCTAIPSQGGDTATATSAFVVDRTAPTVSFTNPSNGATLSGVVNILATASDTRSGLARLNLTINGGLFYTRALMCVPFISCPITTGTNVATCSYSWPTAEYPNKGDMLTATATDRAGNIATADISVTVNNAAGNCVQSGFTVGYSCGTLPCCSCPDGHAYCRTPLLGCY